MKNFIRIFALALGLSSAGQAFAGIPVIDAANVAQAIKQVAAWKQQYQQMADQYNQMQQQYQSLTGSRGFSSLLNGPAYQQARRMLPPDAQQVLGLAKSGSYGNLASSISAIKQASTTLDAGAFSNPTAAKQWDADMNRAASNKALSMQAYTDAGQRLQTLEGLISQISQTQDPKAIAELQARIQAEQAIIQNEQNKIQAMAMLASAEQQISRQQAREMSIRSAGSLADVPRIKVEFKK